MEATLGRAGLSMGHGGSKGGNAHGAEATFQGILLTRNMYRKTKLNSVKLDTKPEYLSARSMTGWKGTRDGRKEEKK